MTEAYDSPETSSEDVGLQRLVLDGVKAARSRLFRAPKDLGNQLLAAIEPPIPELAIEPKDFCPLQTA